MPLSTFDGEPSEELHEHYDPQGNPTGSTVVTRPGWSDDDRAWALGLQLREDNQCSRCGHDLNEALDPAYLWKPNPPAVCLACVGLQGSMKKHEKHQHHRAMLHTVTKVEKPKPRNRR